MTKKRFNLWLVKIIRVPALFFDLPICSFTRKISIKERQTIIDRLEAGDILLTDDKLFLAWRMLAAFLGSPCYSHSAIYEGEQRVVEATTFHSSGCGVGYTAVQDFLSGRKNICVLRPAYRSKEIKNEMFVWIRQQVGKPFDYCFNRDSEHAMYCSKLVAKAMNIAGFSVVTKRNFGREGYVPDAFIRMSGVSIIYDKCETIASKLLNYLPLMLGLSVWLTGVAPLWIICLVLLGTGGLQLKVKI